MNWFKKNNNNHASKAENNMEEKGLIQPEMERFEKIFIDDQEPESKSEKEATSEPEVSQSRIEEFLSRDHHNNGFSDGYNYHSSELMLSKLEEIKGEFLWVLESEIDRLQVEMSNLRVNQVQLSDEGLWELREGLQQRIKQLEANISKIRVEIDLISPSEGLVSTVISAYRNGYIRGIKQYQETELLAKSTGLFN